MRRHFLKDREIKTLLEKTQPPIKDYLSERFLKDGRVERAEMARWMVYLFDGRSLLVEAEEGAVFPTLTSAEVLALLPKVVVDMGAVPSICNGADLMAPGIVRVDGEFGKDSLITILDEKNRKPIAVGLSNYPSSDLAAARQGKVAKNIHYVGDRLWRALLSSGLARG